MNNETKSRKNPIIDKKLTPDIRSFLQPGKSLGSSLTNAIKVNETKSRKNPILDKKLAPDIRSFLQPRKSLGSSLTNAIKVKTSANPGIENHVVYTCTQSQNGDSNPEIKRKLHE